MTSDPDRSWARLYAGVVLAAASILGSATARADDEPLPVPLRVGDVVRIAKAHRAEIVAARARASAASQRPAIVSALDDPMVSPTIDHLPFTLGGADVSLNFEQRFPLSGIRGYRRRAAEAGARRERAEAERVGLEVELDAASAFWLVAETRASKQLVDEQRLLADQVVKAAMSRYAASAGAQADVLRAQLEVYRLDSERDALVAEIRSTEAMLNTSLARSIDAPVPELEFAVSDAEPSPAGALAGVALERRPELRAGRAEIARAEAEVLVMRSMYKPMAVVRAGPSYTMAEGSGVMLMVGITIPLWRGKLRAGVAEARATVDAANADLTAMRRSISGEAAVARERVTAVRARYLALRDRIVPKAKEALAPTLAAYAANQVPLVSTVEAAQALWLVERELIVARAELGRAWAQLRRATGQETTP